MMGDQDTDDAVLQRNDNLPPEDEAFHKDGVEYVNSEGLSDMLKDAATETSEAWRRMRGIIGPF